MTKHPLNHLSLEEQLAWYKSELDDKNLIINTLLESTPIGYWDWMMQENRAYLSPTFKKIIGYEDHEIENKPEAWQEIMYPDDLKDVLVCLDKHLSSKGKIPFSNTARYYHKKGSLHYVYFNGHVVEWDEVGKPIRMLVTHVDVTHLKQTEKKLSLRNNELENFVYATSHDLKEPLRNISSFIELLQQTNIADKEKKQYIDIVDQSAKRMSSLIQGLLEHSRIGKEIELTTVNMKDLLDEVCTDLQARISARNARVLYPKDLPIIRAFPTALKVLFQNLVSNAIKFTRENKKPNIEISYIADNTYHNFTIQDNGIGIAEDKQDEIFKLFKRLNTQEAFEGIGIGLTHCKKIVRLHNGNIEVVNSSSEGSTFVIRINKSLG